jgi:uncharacterized protein YyaL (SSP411 family)
MLAASDLLEEAASVVIAGDPSDIRAKALARAALAAPDPAVVVLRAASADGVPAGHPAHGKGAGPDGPVAYVCRLGVCGLPVEDVNALAQSLGNRQLRH